ncbi:MAG: hypothetical protein P8N76_12510 [Pirellulaceae bacterium]|nr:hypothetical protein [Pirellulaceae bacterium]
MKRLPVLAISTLMLAPAALLGEQISPNGNPHQETVYVRTPSITNDSEFINNGQLEVTNSGTLTNNNTLYNAASGYVANDGHLNNKSVLKNFEGCTIYNGGELENLSGGTFTNEGTLENEHYLINRGTLSNSGAWSDGIVPGAWLMSWGTLINTHILTNTGKLTNTTSNDSKGGHLYNIAGGTINNYGMLINESGGKLLNAGTLNNAVGGSLTNNGTIDTVHGTFTNNGTLKGNGAIKGSYTDHGHTKPGNSAGVMTIEGEYFKVEGSKEIELGGHFDGGGDKLSTEHDWLDVTGNVELAGSLDVLLIDDFELSDGMSFNFLRVGGTLTGQYMGLGEGGLVGNFGGHDLFITYAGGDGNDVTLFTVPEPITMLSWPMLAGLAIMMRRRRKTANRQDIYRRRLDAVPRGFPASCLRRFVCDG